MRVCLNCADSMDEDDVAVCQEQAGALPAFSSGRYCYAWRLLLSEGSALSS